MSAWRLLGRELHRAGGQLTRHQINNLGVQYDIDSALLQLREHGLAKRVAPCVWALTEKGKAWCENRVKTFGRNRGMGFFPTWLAPLADTPRAKEALNDDA